MNKLNGWQRAWVVIALVWAAVVIFFASVMSPNSPARIKELKDEAWVDELYKESQYITLSRDELLARMKRAQPKGSFDPVMALPVEKAEAIDAEYDSLIRRYPHDLALHFVNAAAAWAFPLIAIYLLGMGIAWVRAGFKQKRADKPQ